ncbi:MAG: hypothetical protein J7L72_00285 [Candidatus Aminicenantes bacterium]|nr:hypothetical protein [Candidatus Aminicenantes bacterium]
MVGNEVILRGEIYWKGKWIVEELIPRQDDIACLYFSARIIKQKPRKIIVHYRYIPNLKNINGFDDPVRGPLNHLPLIYSIEGLIDEVKIYHKALNDSQSENSFDYLEPDTTTKANPGL